MTMTRIPRLFQISQTAARSLTQSASPFPAFRLAVAKTEPSAGLRSLFGSARSILNRNQQAFLNLDSAGSRLFVRRIIGFSVAYGIANSSPGLTFAMNGNDHYTDMEMSYSDSVIDRDQQALWAFLKKVWIPSLFIVNVVMMSWNRPIELAIKIFLALLTTNPNPFSIYISVEQLCEQYKPPHPWSYYTKPPRATEVNVTDYKLFCIGEVVVRDQEYTLIGILGSWWIWPSHLHYYLQFQHGFDEILNKARERLTYEVPKPAVAAS